MSINIIKSILLFSMTCICLKSSAQSYVTYNHDDAKMNQITVGEIGVGGLTPAFYYDLFHNSYQRTAAQKNKLGFRSAAALSAYLQIDDADSVEECMKSRAKIEALNIADRQIDIAWLAEGTKINNKLSSFQNNINRIVSVGGSPNDQKRWTEYYNMFQCAIKATKDAYMPNAQRKKQYLAIYADITKENETLIAYLVQLDSQRRTAELLSAYNRIPDRRAANATQAYSRWRDSGWRAKGRTINDD